MNKLTIIGNLTKDPETNSVKRAERAEEQVTQLKQENQQLKEQFRENIRLNSSQKNTAIEYLNKVKAMFKETDYNVDWIFNRIDKMIKELKNKCR